MFLDHARHPVCVYWVKSYLPAHHHHRCLSHTPPAGTAQTHCVSNSDALHTAGCVAVPGQLVRSSSLTTARRAGHPGVRAGKRRGKPRRPPRPRRPPQAGRTTAPLAGRLWGGSGRRRGGNPRHPPLQSCGEQPWVMSSTPAKAAPEIQKRAPLRTSYVWSTRAFKQKGS